MFENRYKYRKYPKQNGIGWEKRRLGFGSRKVLWVSDLSLWS